MRLLVDYDGVMLRSASANRFQAERSAAFVRKVTGLPYAVCERMNRQHYRRHGHTVHMLHNMFPDAAITLKEYNEEVFSARGLSGLRIEPDARVSATKAFELFAYCNKNGLPCNVFTNAPAVWVSHTSEGLIPEDAVISPDNDLNFLKPTPPAYDRVESMFQEEMFFFIDDNAVNLETPSQRPRWHCIHFTDDTVNLVSSIIPHTLMRDL